MLDENYFLKISKLSKKLKRIGKKKRIGIDEYYCWKGVDRLNKILDDNLKIADDEYEYLDFERNCWTIDGEERYDIVLRYDDRRNLNIYSIKTGQNSIQKRLAKQFIS